MVTVSPTTAATSLYLLVLRSTIVTALALKEAGTPQGRSIASANNRKVHGSHVAYAFLQACDESNRCKLADSVAKSKQRSSLAHTKTLNLLSNLLDAP